MKKRYIIFIIFIIIFFGSFIIEYILNDHNLYFRLWFNLLISYYRWAFLFVSLIIIPFIFLFKDCKKWILLLVTPVAIFSSVIFLFIISFSKIFHTKDYFIELKGQNVIAMELRYNGDLTTIYYVPVNTFFMERSADFPFPYEP